MRPLLLILLSATLAFAADPAIDATTCGSPSYDGTGMTYTTGSITVASNPNRVMIARISGRNVAGGDGWGVQTSGGVTFNGSATGWTRVTGASVKPTGLSGYMFEEFWYLDSPTVTTATVVVTANSTGTPVSLGGCVTTIYNATQAGPATTGLYDPQSDQSTWDISPTFITASNGNAIFDLVAINGLVTMGAQAGRVESFNQGVSDGVGFAGSHVVVQATAGAFTLDWTSGAVKGVQGAASWAPAPTGIPISLVGPNRGLLGSGR